MNGIIISILLSIFVFAMMYSGSFQTVIGETPFTYSFSYEKGDVIRDVRQYIPKEPLKIGSSTFISGDLSNTCTSDPEMRVPFPADSCWRTEFIYENEYFQLTHNQNVDLNKYINVEFTAQGKMKEKDDWVNYYKFSIIDTSFLDVKKVEVTQQDVGLEIEQSIPVDIYYDLTNGAEGEIIYTIETLLYPSQTRYSKPIQLKRGWNRYYINWDPEVLGINLINVQPQVILPFGEIRTQKEVEYAYKVLSEAPDCQPVRENNACGVDNCGIFYNNCLRDCLNDECINTGEDEEEIPIDNNMFIIFGIVGVALVLMLAFKKA